MRTASQVVAAGCAALCAVPVFAALWTWTGGGGANHNWDNCDNWNRPYLDPCYPSWDTDDVLIPTPSPYQAWTINLITEQIDTMTIEGSVHFAAAESSPALQVTELSIDAPANHEVELTISGASIYAGPVAR